MFTFLTRKRQKSKRDNHEIIQRVADELRRKHPDWQLRTNQYAIIRIHPAGVELVLYATTLEGKLVHCLMKDGNYPILPHF